MKRAALSVLISVAFLTLDARNAIDFKRVDALYKICPSDSQVPVCNDTLRAARGECATLQFLLESEDGIENPSVLLSWKGRKPSVTVSYNWVNCFRENMYADDSLRLQEITGLYPDPVQSFADSGTRATAWVDIRISGDAKPGIYRGKVTLTANDGKPVRENFVLKIYDVTLPEKQSLTVTNWHYSEGLEMMNGGEEVERGSERYFELLEKIAVKAAEYRQNCWCICCKPDAGYNSDGTVLNVDFSKFDREVELLMRCGGLQRMTCGHFGWKDGNRNNELRFLIPCWNEDKGCYKAEVYADDPRLDRYISLYFPQLQEHLRQKGWLGIYANHLADEPKQGSVKSWEMVAGKIKAAAPEIKTVEACFQDFENMDIKVLLLGSDIAEQAPTPEGKERWMYVCVVPQQNFANRFLQQPLLKTRLLHWINYRYGATGFLHWGLNWWDNYGNIRIPDGDAFLLYPGPDEVYGSLRAYAQRDGTFDYELLKMIEKRDAAKAMEFARELIYAPDSYNLNIPHFRSVRRRMLEYLEGTR